MPKQVSYKNIFLSYTESGKGSALVLLHGFLESAAMWNSLNSHLSKKYRVIAIDLLGHGQTGCLGYIHTMEDMADAVHAVITELKLRKIILIGHSMGGYVSLAFGELYPDMVKGMVLVASTARADHADRKLNRDRAIELIKKNSDLFVTMSLNNIFVEETKSLFLFEIEQTKTQALHTSKQGLIAALEGMKARPDREVLLHFSPYPIIMLSGIQDTIIPYTEAEEQVKGTPVQLKKLSGGHMLHIECETELMMHIKQFLKRL